MSRSRRQQILGARPPRSPRRQQGGRGGAPSSPMPYDSTAEREGAELGNEAGDTRARLTTRFLRQQEDLGFGAGAANPYSSAALLVREREAAQRGSLQTAGNSLYAGSTLNASREIGQRYDEGRKKLEQSYDRARTDYEEGGQQTERDYRLGLAKIKEGALNRALEREPAPLAPGRRAGSGGVRGSGRRQPVRGRRR